MTNRLWLWSPEFISFTTRGRTAKNNQHYAVNISEEEKGYIGLLLLQCGLSFWWEEIFWRLDFWGLNLPWSSGTSGEDKVALLSCRWVGLYEELDMLDFHGGVLFAGDSWGGLSGSMTRKHSIKQQNYHVLEKIMNLKRSVCRLLLNTCRLKSLPIKICSVYPLFGMDSGWHYKAYHVHTGSRGHGLKEPSFHNILPLSIAVNNPGTCTYSITNWSI